MPPLDAESNSVSRRQCFSGQFSQFLALYYIEGEK